MLGLGTQWHYDKSSVMLVISLQGKLWKLAWAWQYFTPNLELSWQINLKFNEAIFSNRFVCFWNVLMKEKLEGARGGGVSPRSHMSGQTRIRFLFSSHNVSGTFKKVYFIKCSSCENLTCVLSENFALTLKIH